MKIAINSFQSQIEKVLPREYVEFIQIFDGEADQNAPFYRGKPMVGFEAATRDYRALLQYPPRSQNEQYLSFIAEEGNGLYVKLADDVVGESALYYMAHGVSPRREFRSIWAFLSGMVACLNEGLLSVVTGQPRGEEWDRQRAIFRKIGAID